MSAIHEVTATTAGTVPLRRALPRLVRSPLDALVGFADEAGGEIVRLNFGTFRPYMVTHPTHLQHVLRDNASNYTRDGKGLLWRPVRRAVGEAILVVEGPLWESSRGVLQPLFTAKRVETLIDAMAAAIGEAVDALDEPARTGQAVDASDTLSRIVCQATMRVLFGDKISVPDAMRIVAALGTIATAMVPRLLVPFMPDAIPMPGDRAFRDAVRTIDDIVLPIISETLRRPDDGQDIFSTLCRPRMVNGQQITERQIRDDVVAMFSTSTETTIAVLSWLWPVLDTHPEVAARLVDEIDQVVGAEQLQRSHVAELRYTRMVLDELLRLFPAGWMIPRTAVESENLGGTRIPSGATILVSPYVTQRMAAFWERPGAFDPERFSPTAPRREHRNSYFPFGGGPHQCIGQYLFLMEAPLIIATLLSRFRIQMHGKGDLTPRMGASLRPRQSAQLTLVPVDRPRAS
ncbi:cytochrome P450 [Dactylosporangium darangshiense]|uniref:Cytochrome P450 n=1 Tax=Dactylosporangium darangshiense TaxID=579108 RepID=A0ABP8D2R0_9ACTN